jgi:hypothetical protein
LPSVTRHAVMDAHSPIAAHAHGHDHHHHEHGHGHHH